MTQIKQSMPERALFLIRELSIKPRAQGASCCRDKKHARPLYYRLGHSSCTIQTVVTVALEENCYYPGIPNELLPHATHHMKDAS